MKNKHNIEPVEKQGKTFRFSIRKLSVGVASVAVAAFWIASGLGVSADELLVVEQEIDQATQIVEENPEELLSDNEVVLTETEILQADLLNKVADAEQAEEQLKEQLPREADSSATNFEIEVVEELNEQGDAVEANVTRYPVDDMMEELPPEAEEIPVRLVTTTYRVQYIDIESDSLVHQSNYSVQEETTNPIEEPHGFKVAVALELDSAPALSAYVLAEQQEILILDNAIQAIVTEKSRERTFKVNVRRDQVSSSSEDTDTRSYIALRAVSEPTAQKYTYTQDGETYTRITGYLDGADVTNKDNNTNNAMIKGVHYVYDSRTDQTTWTVDIDWTDAFTNLAYYVSSDSPIVSVENTNFQGNAGNIIREREVTNAGATPGYAHSVGKLVEHRTIGGGVPDRSSLVVVTKGIPDTFHVRVANALVVSTTERRMAGNGLSIADNESDDTGPLPIPREDIQRLLEPENTPPVIEVSSATGIEGEVIDLTTFVEVTDKEDDADSADDKETEVIYRIIAPDQTSQELTATEAKNYVPTQPGDYQVVVVARDSHGEETTADFLLTVERKPSQAEQYEPIGQNQTIELGTQVSPESSLSNLSDLPSGTSISFKDPVDTNQAGEHETTIVITYPDGTVDEVSVTITVEDNRTDAEKYTPAGVDQVVDLGSEVSPESSVSNLSDLPSGTSVSFKDPVDTSQVGTQDSIVVVTYPDGTVDEVPVTITVEDNRSDAEKYSPTGVGQVVDLGTQVSPESSVSNLSDLPSGTSISFKEPVDTNQVGEHETTVVITYPDGTVDEVPVTITVEDNRSDAEKYSPTRVDQVVDLGSEVSPESSVSNLSDLPSGTIVSFKEPVDTSQVGTQDVIVVVTYPDGTIDEVPVTITVEDNRSDAEKYSPTRVDQVVDLGSEVSPESSVSNLSDLPSGTIVSFKEPVDTSQVGTQDVIVVVTYPDGTIDEVPVTITVEDNRIDAEKYSPVGVDQVVDLGSEVSPESSVSNLPDLPSGTTVSFKDPVDTSQVGTQDVIVVVTYPDGTIDEVPVTITVDDNRIDAEKYSPVGVDQVVDLGSEVSPESSVSNLPDLPSGTTVSFKEPVNTDQVGEHETTVVITYPDGTVDEVSVTIIVEDNRTDAEKYIPVVVDQVVDLDSEVSPESSVSNLPDLPSGTTVDFKEPVNTDQVGEYEATIVITYPDGTVDEVPVTITVEDNRSDAEKYHPVVVDQVVDLGSEVSPESSVSNLSGLPSGTMVNFKEPVDTTQVDEHETTIVITYPDGTVDEVSVTITVEDNRSDNEKYIPVGVDQVVDLGSEVSPESSVSNLPDLPLGTTVSFKDPVDTSQVGTQEIIVVVTYPDGTVDEVPVTITVEDNRTDSEKYTPVGIDQVVDLGSEVSPESSVSNLSDLPSGTMVDFKEPVNTDQVGNHETTVVITYPDGTIDEVPVTITVEDNRSDADKYSPVVVDQVVDLGSQVSPESSVSNLSDLPSGTSVSFKEPVDTAQVGEHEATIVITYPDGTVDEVPVTITVEDNRTDAEKYIPVGVDQVVDLGSEVSPESSLSNLSDLPSGTTVSFKDPVDTSQVGTQDVIVVVTYPDGTIDEVPVTIIVEDNRSDADKYSPVVVDQVVDLGSQVSPESSVSNLSDLPSGTSVSFKEPVDTAQVGEHEATIVITYPDGTVDEVPVTITVEDNRSDAEKYTPVGVDQVVDLGSEVSPESSVSNLPDLPSGTTVSFKSPVDTNQVGTHDVIVVVTYPDGTVDEVPVTITVEDNRSDAEKYNPVVVDQVVELGSEVSPESSLSNLSDLPSGISVSFKEPVDTSQVGNQEVVVVVTYPDGTVDEVPVTITVEDNRTDAEKYSPAGVDQVVDLGSQVYPESSVSNLSDLPAGTTVDFKEPVDTDQVGTQDAIVVITYPDGTVDEVPVIITVEDNRSDNEKYIPVGVDQVVDLGSEVSPESIVSNLPDLPSGTSVSFKEPVDTGQVGEHETTAVITYPDGTVDEVPVTITVEDNRTDSEKYIPVGVDQVVDLDSEVSPESSVSNLPDLPSGTSVSFKEPVDTSQVGTHETTVVIIYPDGTVDEVPVTLTVDDNRSDSEKHTPVVVDQVVDLGTEFSPESSVFNLPDLPSGTTVSFKEPVDTSQVGTQDVIVVVTYPDGTVDEVPVTITIEDNRPDSEKYTPIGIDQVVDLGSEVSPESGVSNLSDLPSGTSVSFKEPVDTSQVGERETTIVLTYPDGTVDEVPIIITVEDNRSDADKYTPVGIDQVVDLGSEVSPESSVSNLSDLPSGTSVSFKEPVDTSQVSTHDVIVVITYPDGTVDEVPVTITVEDNRSDAEKYHPVVVDQVIDLGSEVSPESSVSNLSDLPSGTSVSFKEPVDTSQVGDHETTIVLTYPDGTVDEVPVTITVEDNRPDSEKYTPVGIDKVVDLGSQVSPESSVSNLSDLPSGTSVSFKEPVDTNQVGDHETTIVIIYPDGTVDEVSVTITVEDNRSDAEKYNPTGVDQVVDLGSEVSPESSVSNLSDLPSGTSVSFKEPVDTSQVGEHEATIVITYPDGTVDEVSVTITVEDNRSDADKYAPVGIDRVVDLGSEVSPESIVSNLPDLPSDTTVSFKEPVDTSQVGDHETTVVITYPDGTVDEVPVTITVEDNRSDAEKYHPVVVDQVIDLGSEVSPESSVSNLPDLPSGTTVSFKEPVDTSQVGTQEIVVVVIYPDGTVDEVPVIITVEDNRSDAEKYTPVGVDQVVELGSEVSPESSLSNLSDLPSGTSVSFKEPVDTSQVGTQEVVVVVTYPDGTVDEVPVTITVEDNRSDNEKYIPVVVDQVVDLGSEVSPESSVSNLSDLPSGTSVSFKEPVDTNQVGEHETTVVITYHDGTVDEVSVTIIVEDNRSDAEKYSPTGVDQVVDLGSEVSPESSVSNLSDLPSGTSVSFKEPVDINQVGEHETTVVITYPDGTIDEVPVTITVDDNRIDAEKYSPTGVGQVVDLGTQVSPESSVSNLPDLPSGTTVDFKEPVNTNQVGEHEATIVITYPDGTVDEVSVTITVEDNRTALNLSEVTNSEPIAELGSEVSPKSNGLEQVASPRVSDKERISGVFVDTQVSQEINQLPRTGENDSSLTWFGLGFILSSLGLVGKRRRKS